MIRQIIIVAIAVVFLLGSLYMAGVIGKPKPPKKRPPSKQEAKLVKTQTVANKEIQANINLYGRLAPYEKTELFAEVGGMLINTGKPFKEGTRFAKGQLLLSIDNQEQQLNLRAQRAALLTTITQMMPDIKIDFPESLEQWNEYRKNFDVEKILPELPKPKSDREKDFITLKNIYNQYYSIRSLEERMTKYTVTAPFTGELTEALINTGSLIRAGQKIGTLMNTSVYELVASIPVEELKYTKIGDPVTLVSEDVEGTWQGRINRISSTIDTKTQTVKLFIRVAGANLRENMFLTGEIKADIMANVVEVSRNLLFDDNQIYTVVGDTTLKVKEVQIAKLSETTALIKGLNNGTKLLTENFPGAYDGIRINVVEEE